MPLICVLSFLIATCPLPTFLLNWEHTGLLCSRLKARVVSLIQRYEGKYCGGDLIQDGTFTQVKSAPCSSFPILSQEHHPAFLEQQLGDFRFFDFRKVRIWALLFGFMNVGNVVLEIFVDVLFC